MQDHRKNQKKVMVRKNEEFNTRSQKESKKVMVNKQKVKKMVTIKRRNQRYEKRSKEVDKGIKQARLMKQKKWTIQDYNQWISILKDNQA